MNLVGLMLIFGSKKKAKSTYFQSNYSEKRLKKIYRKKVEFA